MKMCLKAFYTLLTNEVKCSPEFMRRLHKGQILYNTLSLQISACVRLSLEVGFSITKWGNSIAMHAKFWFPIGKVGAAILETVVLRLHFLCSFCHSAFVQHRNYRNVVYTFSLIPTRAAASDNGIRLIGRLFVQIIV